MSAIRPVCWSVGLRWMVLAMLVLAPLIDLTNRWVIGEFMGRDITPNRLWKLLPGVLIVLLLATTRLTLRPAQKLALAMLVLVTMSLGMGLIINPGVAVTHWLRIGSSFSAILVASTVLREKDGHRFAAILPVVMIVPAMLAVAQLLGLIPYTNFDSIDGRQVGRISGLYQKVPALTIYLVPAAIAAIEVGRRKPPLTLGRHLYWLLGIGFIVLVFLSTHRIAMVGLATGLVVWAMLLLRARKPASGGVFMVGGLVAFATIAVLFVVAFSEYLALDGSFLRGRGRTWTAYWHAWTAQPLLAQLVGTGSTAIESRLYTGDEPHSDVLRLLVANGLLGLAVWLAWLGLSFVQALKSSKVILDLSTTLAASTLATIAVMSITFEPSQYPGTYWMLAGFLGASSRVAQRQLSGSPSVDGRGSQHSGTPQ